MQSSMHYVGLKKSGDASVMELHTMPVPTPAANEILIRVHAAGINRPDIFQREGSYPPPPDASPILGLEVAGEIIACGKHVTEFTPGDHVCALVNGGGYAEYALAPAHQCLAIPKGFSMLQAAALPENFFTVWHNLWQRAHIQRGESLLIHGGSSGIGTAAIQIAVANDIRVFATAGSHKKCEACAALGATSIHYGEKDFVDIIKSETANTGVNVILDMVGGDYIQRNFSAAAKDGRIVNIAFLNGSKANVDFNPLMLKRLTLTGSTLRAQSAGVKSQIAAELKKNVWPLLECGKIKPVIDSVFSLKDVVQAHEYMQSGQHIGKIMLSVV